MSPINDLWGQLSKLVDRYRFSMIGLTLAVLIIAIPLGCQAQAKSPFNGQKASEVELLAQAEAYSAVLEAKLTALGNNYTARSKALDADYTTRMSDLQAQYANDTGAIGADGQAKAVATEAALAQIASQKDLIQKTIESVQSVASTAAPGYGGLIASAVGLASLALGLGAARDNLRKDKVISKLKNTGDDAIPKAAVVT